MKKKIGIISVVLIIVIVIILAVLLTKKENDKQLNNESTIAYMYEDEAGEYEPGSIDEWNEGYALNEEESSCDGEKELLSWDNNTNEVLLTTDKPTKCNLYFDKKEYVLLSGYPINDKDVQLTNVLGTDGDFENVDAWQGNVNHALTDSKFVACEMETDIKKHGTYSCKISGDPIYKESNVTSTNKYAVQLNHKYYIKFSAYKNSYTNNYVEFWWTDWKVTDVKLHLEAMNDNAYDWETFSFVEESNEALSEMHIRLDNNNWSQATDIYFDELIIIDLTESFNDKIPTKDELDKELIYFDGTVDMKKAKGKEGVFEVPGVPNNASIECNNGGHAVISDGKVTITGGAPITTCYLKKEQS